MRILITGSNGYLGRGVVSCLLDCGHEVIATDYFVDDVDERAIRMACDLFSIEDPYNYFHQPNILLHLAWKDGFVHYSDSHILELPNHYLFIKKFMDSGIDKISVMGSMHEVGFYEGCIKNDTPCNPVTPYGISKNTLRMLTGSLCERHDIRFQWLRGYYIVGNTEYGSSIFSKIVKSEKNGEKFFPFTMGQNQFDFLDYDDFCLQVARAISQDEYLGIINICSGHPERLSERVERFIKENKYSIKLKYGVFPDRPYDSKAVWGDGTIINNIMKGYNTRN